jgi:hypothetical protein
MTSKIISGALAVLLAMSTAHATVGVAQLSQLQGKVLVNHGKGFEPANGLVELSAGDKVLVGKESSATLSYMGSDCTVTVAESSVVTVSEVAPCKAGEVVGAVDSVIVIPAQAEEGGGAAVAPFIVGGFILTAAAIGILIATEDNNNNPVSAP